MRDIASSWAESQPPALPSVVNSSNGLPSSSKFTVTNIVPWPVRTLSVTPLTVMGRSRGTRYPSGVVAIEAAASLSLSWSSPAVRTSSSREPER